MGWYSGGIEIGYEIIFDPEAEEDYKLLPPKIKAEVNIFLDEVKIEGLGIRYKKLEKLEGTDGDNDWKISFSNFRVLFAIYKAKRIMYIVGIPDRKKAYRNLRKRFKKKLNFWILTIYFFSLHCKIIFLPRKSFI